MKRSTLTIIATLLAACSQPPPSHAPPATSPESLSALPAEIRSEGDSYCTESSPDEWRGFEPSLSAWLHAADSVFVGTIASVTEVEAPIYHEYLDDEGATRYKLLADVSECPPGGDVLRAIRIEFEDVEVLQGDQLGDTLTIEMGRLRATTYPGVFFREGDDHLTDSANEPVYFPGARVGAALFTDDDGTTRWNYQQFEVLNGKVQLQPISDEPIQCNTIPKIFGIPDEYNNMPIDEFAAALQAVGPPTTAELQSEAYRRHERWLTAIDEERFKFRSHANCIDPDPPSDPDSDNNRDPDVQ